MPDVNSIPFRQAAGNGHYESKQLPNDNQDFLAILGLPVSLGNVTSVTTPSRDGQLAQYWQTGGITIKGSTAIGLVDLVDGVVTTKTTPAGEIVGTTAIQTLTNKTLVTPVITGAISGLDKSSVGLGNVDNTSDANKPVSTAQQAALNLKQDLSLKGVANGYAGLDATAKVPTSQLPAAVVGGVSYQGAWNAATNSPVIPAASAANKGWYYVVSVAGTTTVDGVSEWAVKDWIVSNGTTWDKADHTDLVTSVAGRQGAVVLTKTDVGLDQVDNTSDATKNSAAGTLTNKVINGANNALTVRLDTGDVTGNMGVVHQNSGTGANQTSFWRGDGVWATPAGGGDVAGPGGAVDGQIALFNGTTGTSLKATSATGLSVVNLGVHSTVAKPAGVVVGTTDIQTLSQKTLTDPVNTVGGFSYRPSGVLMCNTTFVGTSAPSVDTTVWNLTIPAGMLYKDGDSLRVTFYIITSTPVGSKLVRLWLGSEYVYAVDNTTTTAVNYTHHVVITRNGAASQAALSWFESSVNTANNAIGAGTAQNWGTALVLSLKIFAAGAANTVQHRFSQVEFLPVP